MIAEKRKLFFSFFSLKKHPFGTVHDGGPYLVQREGHSLSAVLPAATGMCSLLAHAGT